MNTHSSFVAVVVLALFVHSAGAAYCHGHPDPNAKPNNYPIFSEEPTLVRTGKNAKAYKMGAEGFDFWVVHVWGSPYEMGYAQGSIMRDEARAFINDVWSYMEGQVEGAIDFLPKWLSQDLANAGLDIALDWTYEMTVNFTNPTYYQELQGLADAIDIDVKKLVRIHLIGELTKGDCSMYGAWGDATASTGKTLQLRSLDWDVQGPFKNFAAVQIYHPNSDNGHAFANVGFLGWAGSLSGMSSKQMAISEIGVSFPDSTFGKESRQGNPFTFLLRDILQYDSSYLDSIHRIKTANRTCDLILGVGDGKTNASTFRGFQYSYSVANVMTPENQMPYNQTWHPRIPDVVYYGMDWDCPSYNEVMAQQIKKFYGNLTPEVTISNIISIAQTGDVHAAVYDLTDSFMYVSFARPDNCTVGPKMAYDRQFSKLNLTALFSVSRP